MTTGCLVLARDDPEASWVARGERPWIKHAVDHPLSESEELGTSQIPGASHTPRPPHCHIGEGPDSKMDRGSFLPIIHLPATPSCGPQMLTQLSQVPGVMPGS